MRQNDDVDIEDEIRRRLDELRAHPERLRWYDVSGDGEVDEDEWAVVERIVATEVHTEHALRSPAHSKSIEPETLVDRYELIGLLGRGGQGVTYLARDLAEDRHVVVKELTLSEVEDWKALELFEREADVLEHLDHERIPGYVDALHLDDDGVMRFFLVQEYAEGPSLQSLLDDGERWTEEDVRALLSEMDEVFAYIHGQSPPVVHRDIKPSNIVRGTDNRHYLIDFGAVQAVLPKTVGGTTIVGTAGYVPFEQFHGRAVPASDVYAMAATVLHLMTGVHPSKLDHGDGTTMALPDELNASEPLRRWLSRSLSIRPADRPSSLSEVAEEPSEEDSTSSERATGALTKSAQGTFVPVDPPRVPDITVFYDDHHRKVTQAKSGGKLLAQVVEWDGEYSVKLARRHSRALPLRYFVVVLLLLMLFFVPKVGPVFVAAGIGLILWGMGTVAYHRLEMTREECLVDGRSIDWRDVRKFTAVDAKGSHHAAGVRLELDGEELMLARNVPSEHARYLVSALNDALKKLS